MSYPLKPNKRYLRDTQNWYNGRYIMSLDKIQQLVHAATKTVEDNEKLATPVLAVKLAKAVVSNPHDQTIGMLARVIKDLADKNTIFIRRSEFKDLARRYHSRNSNFAELFQEELGEPPQEPIITTAQHDGFLQANPYHVAGDQVLANALESVFDKQIPLKMYSQPLADKALKSVGSTLNAWNLTPTSLTVSVGSDQFIIIKANYETPKGITSFFVPVEIENKDIVEASVFMGNAGPQELNHNTIKSYLTSLAGSKLKVNADSILSVLTIAASENREVSNAELALTRLNAKRQGESDFFEGASEVQKMAFKTSLAEKPNKDVQLPQLEESKTFEDKFNTAQGLAAWKYGLNQVNSARNHIVRELATFGHKNPQIVVTGHDDRTIMFGVAIDTGKVAFTVPVKIVDGKIFKPTVMLCNGSVASFNQVGINQFITENRVDNKVAAAASTLSALKPSEVISDVRKAITDRNFEKAEDALNVLANSGDTKAYATAFQIYMNGLAGRKPTESKCQHVVKSAKTSVSEFPICAQTGLPVNKVYQDKNGNCRPLYRQGMDETYEGAVFNNAKIFG